MKNKLISIACVLALIGFTLHAQLPQTTITNGAGNPVGACVSGSTYTDSTTGFIWPCKGNLWLAPVVYAFSGQTSTIGGGALTSGSCASGTVAITNITLGMVTMPPSPNNNTFPGAAFTVTGLVTANGTVTVNVCNVSNITATPASTRYNVRVFP